MQITRNTVAIVTGGASVPGRANVRAPARAGVRRAARGTSPYRSGAGTGTRIADGAFRGQAVRLHGAIRLASR